VDATTKILPRHAIDETLTCFPKLRSAAPCGIGWIEAWPAAGAPRPGRPTPTGGRRAIRTIRRGGTGCSRAAVIGTSFLIPRSTKSSQPVYDGADL